FNSGNLAAGCELSNEQITGGQCIRYNSGTLDSYEESDFEVEADFPEFPKYKIEGVLAAIAEVYDEVQTKLSAQGRKLILNEKIGWESDMILRAYNAPPF